ncbi:MAG: ATP-binding protein [Candidatus Margulisiibacteriota bacterium]
MVESIRSKSTIPPQPLRIRGRMADHLTAGVALLNIKGRVLSSNAAFKQLLGPSASLHANPRFLDMLRQPNEGSLLRLLGSNFDPIKQKATLKDLSGKIFSVEYKLVKVKRGQVLCEVTPLQEPEEEAPSTSEQQRLMRAGETALQLTHALKGATNTISRALVLLGEEPTPETFAKIFPILNRSVTRASTIITDVLRIGRGGEIEFKEINLCQLLDLISNFEEVSSKLQKFGIELEIKGNCPLIEGVEIELMEAFVCLIDNAIDAIAGTQRTDGKILITLRDEKNKQKEVSIAIHDNGSGIRPEKMADILKRFYSTKRDGSGLGLSFAQKAIEETHGGRMDITSRFGEGTTFTIRLKQQPPKDLLIQRPSSDYLLKMRATRQLIMSRSDIDSGLVIESLYSMNIEHLRDSTVEELAEQIEWQIKRLDKFIETGQPHVSVNNFSRRTEIVLATKGTSAIKARWIEIIDHEMERLGLAADCTIAATRKINKRGAVCRIFEIRKHGSLKLDEEERSDLEAALNEKITALPTHEEMKAQNRFFATAFNTLLKLDQDGSLLSLIFSLSVRKKTPRLVGIKVKLHPSDLETEGSILRKYGKKLPPANEILVGFMEQLSGPDDIFWRNEEVSPELLENLGADSFVKRQIGLYNINSALICAFQTAQRYYVINILSSAFPGTIPEDIVDEFLAANHSWKSTV